MAKANPRQSDIARITGVSQATVSLILTGRAAENSIPTATQQRVLEAATQLGYVPNVNARSLRGGRNGLIGVHTFEPVFPIRSEDYYNEFLVGIEEQAVQMGLDLVLFASTQRADGTRSIYGKGSNRLRVADGAVLLGISGNDEELDRLAKERYPFVFIGRRDRVSARMPYVVPDYHAALDDVLTQLHDTGHVSIAYLGKAERTVPQEDRLSAFVEHAARLDLDPRPPVFLAPAEVTAEWVRFTLDNAVTAVVVESYELAEALTHVARAAGIDIPERLSMVCLDVGPRGLVAQNWSHIQVPRRDLGRRAVAILMDLLDGRIAPEYHETLPITPPSFATIARPRPVSRRR
jgi:DNA-binding LacI/PurR family transcriptional regulator